ncbi:MAG: NAD-dependent epimerase/dehydratase [Microgenomates group bacterium GW2011_GWA1_48_10]|nr:MAG: NAD-dependent epimerase/dehydratase [Microgenomates group bacterium GW2011_GWA1_48_10]
MNSKTILFGGSGFLGPIILEKYPNIVSVGRREPPPYIKNRHIPLPSLDDLGVLDAIDFDKVIFLVGNSNHHRINTRPMMGIEYNVIPLKKILFYLKKRNIKKLIYFSTVLLYDVTKMKNPVDEAQAINPYINEYVFSKYLSEEVAKLYPSVPSIAVRFSNIYGPTKLIRPDLVPMLVQKALSPAKEIVLWNAAPVRDFLYLDDAAEAVVKLLDTSHTGPVNMGSGQSVSVGRIAEIIGKLAGKPVRDMGRPVSGPMHFTNDISLLKKLTGWEPNTSIEDGVRLTYGRMKGWTDECRWWEQPDFKEFS